MVHTPHWDGLRSVCISGEPKGHGSHMRTVGAVGMATGYGTWPQFYGPLLPEGFALARKMCHFQEAGVNSWEIVNKSGALIS